MRGAGARVARHGARATRGAFGARGRYQWHPGQHSQVRHILQGFLNLNPSLSNLQVYSLHDTSAKFQVRCSMPREKEPASCANIWLTIPGLFGLLGHLVY